MFVPFSKIDKERRMVWGIAQAEVPDSQDDYLDYNASVRAFTNWQKNVRQMHEDVAVGRAMQIQFDPKKKQIHVGAYISRGAEDCWQKCLDGTYRGYSIGGYPTQAAPIRKDGRRLRHVRDYVLTELSLVDVPSNPACKITAIQKRGTKLVATNVLGAVRTRESNMSTTRTKRSKIESLKGFAKNVGPDDEVYVIKLTDFVKSADGKSLILKNDAALASFTKADLDGDGYSDAADDTTDDAAPDDGGPDLAQHAMNLHDDIHNKAGDEQCDCARDDDAPPITGPAAEGDDDGDMGKSATRTKRKGAFRKSQPQGLTKSDLDTAMADFAKSFDDKLAKFGSSTPAPRKGGADGVLVKRDGGEAGSEDTDPKAASADRLKTLYAKRDEFNKRGSQGISQTERSERNHLAQEIAAAENQDVELRGALAR